MPVALATIKANGFDIKKQAARLSGLQSESTNIMVLLI
jgi:hypothetical protein